jgi:hypothetical protein
MCLSRVLGAIILAASFAGVVRAQDKKGADEVPPLLTASGVVDKADKETLVVKPRGADGKFQKTISLKVTGTSKVTVLTPQKRAGGVVLTQRDVEAKDLVTGQVVAIIYAEAGKEGIILLSAVAEPAK